ncbi:unnamed protein product [Strongylus vulgaris]|uniref:Uncharacterized protein n=1 Tax=Strongylus vulgaris TaxID=40348 RepID=A0A3P7INM8_STRVU|nr:unnamed protein product [Strongylus vulgaris]
MSVGRTDADKSQGGGEWMLLSYRLLFVKWAIRTCEAELKVEKKSGRRAHDDLGCRILFTQQFQTCVVNRRIY